MLNVRSESEDNMWGLKLVEEIMASDVIGWILAFFGGLIAFRIVDNLQVKIERHNVIRDVENSINNLFSSPIAKSNMSIDKGNKDELSNVNVRSVLHDNYPWERYIKGKTKVIIENNQRYIQVRSENGYSEFISTQALHELLILFRRIEKLYKDSIFKPIDLADIWREILPFGCSGRLEFFESYFDKSDIRSIVFVLFNTVLACNKYEIKNGVNAFVTYFSENKKIQEIYYKNSRYTYKEKWNIRKFKKIVQSN